MFGDRLEFAAVVVVACLVCLFM